jgi:hypothetical protein
MKTIDSSIGNEVLAIDDGTGIAWRIARTPDGTFDIMVLGPSHLPDFSSATNQTDKAAVIWIADTPMLIMSMSSTDPMVIKRTGGLGTNDTYEMVPLIISGNNTLGLTTVQPGEQLCVGNEECTTPIIVPAIAPWRVK